MIVLSQYSDDVFLDTPWQTLLSDLILFIIGRYSDLSSQSSDDVFLDTPLQTLLSDLVSYYRKIQ